MKFKILLFMLFISMNITNSQTDHEVSNVYLNRAEASYYENDIDKALELFDKAMKYITEITESRVAKIGMLLHYQIKDYQKAKIFSKQYFELEINKNTDDYLEMLEIYVNINEALEAQKAEDERLERERIAALERKRHLDSMTVIWTTKSQALVIKADKIKPFNQYGIAPYESEGGIGLISDNGNVIVAHIKHRALISNSEFLLLSNNKDKPTKIYCYNSSTKQDYFLPNVTEFNLPSTNFGKITKPKSGKFIAYPNNSLDALVYNLEINSVVNDAITINRLKELKKQDFIDKYDKDGRVKINGNWYNIGTHFGGGIYPLFTDNKLLFGYFLSANGRVLPQSSFNYLGYFSNGRSEVINANETFWIDQNGTRYDDDDNEEAIAYNGTSRIKKLEEGKFQILKSVDGKERIVLGDKQLPVLDDFLKESSDE